MATSCWRARRRHTGSEQATGALEANERAIREFQLVMPDFPILRGLSVGEVAEPGATTRGRGRSSMSWPSTTTAASDSGWFTLYSLGNVAWAAIAVDAAQHRGGCAGCSPTTAARSRWWRPGPQCARWIDSTRGSSRWTGSTNRPTVSSQALAQERSLRSQPLDANTALVGSRPTPARRDGTRTGAPRPSPGSRRRAGHARGDSPDRRPHRSMTVAARR